MMRRALSFCLIAALSLMAQAQAQIITEVSKVGTTSANFLKIEVGARPIAMGGAFVAVADDATAIFWNPAGLARLPKSEVALSHTEWLADMSFDFAGIILPLGGFGTIGASITSLSMGEMEVRTVFYPEGIGEKFNAQDLSLGVSYARNLTDRFSIGFNAKYISQKIWHMSASSFAFDVGTLFTTQFNNMKIGMSISNFGNKMRMEGKDTLINYDPDPVKYGNNDRIPAHMQTDKFSLPLLFRVGLAMDVMRSERSRLTVATDAIHPNDNTESINLGMEYAFNNIVFLRFGYNSLLKRDTEEGITAGAGFQYNLAGTASLKIDYAYADFGRLANAQRFSLAIEF